MDAKTTFLNELTVSQRTFIQTHEFDSNLEQLLMRELNVIQYNLFKIWKNEEYIAGQVAPKSKESISSWTAVSSSVGKSIDYAYLCKDNVINFPSVLIDLSDNYEDFVECERINFVAQLLADLTDRINEGSDRIRERSETILRLEEIANDIKELSCKKSKLLDQALDSNPQEAVDIFLNFCLATRIVLWETVKQLELKLMSDSASTSQASGGNKCSNTNTMDRKLEYIETKARNDRILRSDSHISPDIPMDAPTIDNSRNDGGSIFCVGGFDASNKRSRGVQAYDSKNNKWISLVEMNEIRSFPGLAGANGKLYAIGGHYGAFLDSAEVFDSSSGTWSSIAPMNERAFGVGVAYSNGVIYAIGGLDIGRWGSSERLNKAEKYDIKLDTWTELPSMTAKRSHLGCAVLDGMVYAVGGHLSSCERYNPRLNKWEAIASMKEKRSGLGLCVLNEFLYAVGGYNNDKKKILASVERYDTNTNKWTKVAAMVSPRKQLSVAIMDGLMYAIGGQFDDKNLKSVEVYSPLLDEWSPAADLNEACFGGAAAWVDCSLDGLPAANK